MSSKPTTDQIKSIIVDAGLVYINYGKPDQKLLAPCRGGNKVNFEGEIRQIEVNGTKGKTKGLRRNLSSDVSMEVNFMDLSLSNLKMAIPGAKIVSGKLSNGWYIEDADYLDNVTLLAKNNDGEAGTYTKVTLYNVLVDQPISIETVDKDETVLTVTFSAHYDLSDSNDKLWDISTITAEQLGK